ncbi:MAG: hypothetical protein IIB72_12395 [Proteobacteria bacterium]|nr:hypothetical protein [Pseudomonadota bacterium]
MDKQMLERRLKMLKYEEELLVADFAKQRAGFEQIFDSAEALARENDEIGYKREMNKTVRIRLDQKEMERNVPGSITVLAEAFAPSKPYHDRRIVFTFMALMLGLGAGVAVAFVRGTASQAITEARDLPQTVQSPFLGQLPRFRNDKALSPEDKAVRSEYMRMVRTALLERINGHHGNSVLITSAGPGTGKTTVAVALARSLAQLGKKVLLLTWASW